MAKSTIKSNLFQPTVPIDSTADTVAEDAPKVAPKTAAPKTAAKVTPKATPQAIAPEPVQPSQPKPAAPPQPDKELTHNTSTRIPLSIQDYFEYLAVEHGYSTHSLRIYALTWFAKEHKVGNITLERDRRVKSKRTLAMPKIN